MPLFAKNFLFFFSLKYPTLYTFFIVFSNNGRGYVIMENSLSGQISLSYAIKVLFGDLR